MREEIKENSTGIYFAANWGSRYIHNLLKIINILQLVIFKYKVEYTKEIELVYGSILLLGATKESDNSTSNLLFVFMSLVVEEGKNQLMIAFWS